MTALWVLHDLGDPEGGAGWESALRDAGWAGPLVCPTVHGHAGKPLADGGWFAHVEAGFTAARVLAADPGDDHRVFVGVGRSGWSAQAMALAEQCHGLVLVDGLGGPFVSHAENAARRRASLRDFVAAGTDPGDGPTDARLAHYPGNHGDFELAQEAAEATTAPTLICESAQSGSSQDDVAALAELYESVTVRLDLPDSSPSAIAPTVVQWIADTFPSD